MSMLLTLVLAYAAFRLVPHIVAEITATVIGTLLALAIRRSRRLLLAASASASAPSSWDRCSTKAERRALRGALDTALRMTTFTSLFPHVAVRAYKVANVVCGVVETAASKVRV